MLVWGTANPEAVGCGVGSGGAYFSKEDLNTAQFDIIGKDVLCEHSGSKIGSVVSAWIYEDSLHCIFGISDSVNGSIAKRYIENKTCAELSLGYTMDMQMSADGCGLVEFGRKTVKELSIVVKGARKNCFIHGYVK